MIIEFEIPGEPVAKGRARAYVRNGHVAHYTPDKTSRYENLVRLTATQAMAGFPPAQGAILLKVVAHMPIPRSWSQKKQLAAREGALMHISRPDGDNLFKAILDGCNKVCWVDDAQVVDFHFKKRYSDKPGVIVKIYTV